MTRQERAQEPAHERQGVLTPCDDLVDFVACRDLASHQEKKHFRQGMRDRPALPSILHKSDMIQKTRRRGRAKRPIDASHGIETVNLPHAQRAPFVANLRSQLWRDRLPIAPQAVALAIPRDVTESASISCCGAMRRSPQAHAGDVSLDDRAVLTYRHPRNLAWAAMSAPCFLADVHEASVNPIRLPRSPSGMPAMAGHEVRHRTGEQHVRSHQDRR
jgi:hypothetical protein